MVWGKFTCCNWFLESWVWNLFVQHWPQDLSWGQLSLTAPQGLVNWNGGTSKHLWSSCSYRTWPQGGNTSSYPTLVEVTLEVVGFLGCEFEWNIPEQTNAQGLKSYYYFPLKLYPSPPDSWLPGAPLPVEVPTRLHSQEGALSWVPAPDPWILGDFTLVLEAKGQATIVEAH